MRRPNILIPSIADILFVSVFLLLALSSSGKGLLGDADTGYHIRAGEYILATHSVPKHDIFSFITPAIPWTAHEWLSEVIMALVHKAGGLTGVVLFFSFLIAFTYYLLFRILRSYRSDMLAGIVITLLVIASSQIHWLARPHIFSLLLMLLWYYLLDEYQYRDRNYLFLLPPMMLLWVNLHGGFVIAFAITGIYFGVDLIMGLFSRDAERSRYRKKARMLGVLLAACLVASLINPYGYHILLFPFKLTSNKFIMDSVSEFLPPNFHEPLPFKYLLYFTIAVLALSTRKLNLIELLLVLLFLSMSLYSARYIPLFALIAAPILLRQTDQLLVTQNGRFVQFFRKRAERLAAVDQSARGLLWPATALVVVFALAGSGTIGYAFDQKIKAVKAVEFLRKEHLKGHMFNNDEIGDYIIYAAWPEYRVFFDGRSDMYGVDRIKEYAKVTKIEPGWEDVLKRYDINWIIFNSDSVLSRFLLQRSEWKLIYADRVADIFVRDVPAYRHLIEKYPDVKPVPKPEKDPAGS